MADVVYIPALNESLLNLIKKEPRLNVWGEQPRFYHVDHCLVSYPYFGKQNNLKSVFTQAKIFGDSGGYQVVTRGLKVDITQLVNWGEQSCHFINILDVPPYRPTGTSQFGGEAYANFEKSLEQTAQNAERMNKLRDKLGLYGVVQGETLEQIKAWHKKLSDQHFDGYSLSPKPSSDVKQIIQYLLYAHENIQQPIHILQISGRISSIPVIYFSTKYPHKITIDSASWNLLASKYRWFIVPYSNTYKLRLKTGEVKIKSLPCFCPVCKAIKLEDVMQNTGLAGMYIGIHNLIWMCKHYDFQNTLKEDPAEYKEFAVTEHGDEAAQVFEMIDYGFEHGVDAYSSKYMRGGTKTLAAFEGNGW